MGSRVRDRIGQKFNRLTMTSEGSRFGRAVFRCECGTEKEMAAYSVIHGATKSCGCIKGRIGALAHGMCGKPEWRKTYHAWKGMRKRCMDVKGEDYEYYGGKGVKVCKRWDKFSNFVEDMGKSPPGMTLERKHVDGDYCQENCCWDTWRAQARNRTNNLYVVIDGEKILAIQACERFGIPCERLYVWTSRHKKTAQEYFERLGKIAA